MKEAVVVGVVLLLQNSAVHVNEKYKIVQSTSKFQNLFRIGMRKLIQFIHTIMVPEQVKTMKIQAGIQVSRPGELRVAIGGHGRGLERLIGLNVDAVDDDPHVKKQVSLPARSSNTECIPSAGDTYLSYNLSRVVAHTSHTADRHHYLPPVMTRSSSYFLD
ncbi:hypothetical protein Tco_1468432 [Tanacetum coccineum]